MERRHTRRLVRYWVFLTIAYLIGLGFYVYYGGLHALFSSISASVGMVGPRYLMSVIALYYLTGFVLGIVFLGFDVRARDVREGIAEVLDSRPLTNLELVAGRFVALFLSAWMPIVILVLLIEALGWLLPLLGSPIGRTVEPLSLIGFVFVMALPAIAFTIALVFVTTLLVRNRLLAALVSIAALVGLYWLMFTVPGPYGPLVDFIGSQQVAFPSDIVPDLAPPMGWLQRAGVLVLALGLIGIAAVIHPRLDGGTRWRAASASAVLLAVGAAFLGLVVQQRLGDAARLEHWRSVHEARAGEPVADVLAIEGSIDIEPGQRMDADLEIALRAPPDRGLSRVLLTLNPGFSIDAVGAADGTALTAAHADGLLEIELAEALAPGEETSFRLRYGGAPNTAFGYLDSAIVLETSDGLEAQVGLLGYERGLFDRRYVALMPGIRWLPASGVDVGRDDVRTRRPDYFRVALDVAVPPGWLAAGPGRRQTVGGDGTFRFAPATSVPEVALMAAEFERFATEIDGIAFEVLVHPDHDANFEVLDHARGEIEQWVAERLDVARRAGLEYPFDAFTLVEVPNTLRGYVGGWRLDTALAPPAMMLLRETSFPTARFDFDFFDNFGNSRNYDVEGGAARIDRDRVVRFFSNDFAGGNVFTGAARSFFAHRTSPYGPNAVALEFALDELATLLVSGQRSYFSVHLFKNMQSSINNVIAGIQGRGAASIADAVILVQTEQTDVWESALDSTLADLDPWEDPQRTIDVLTLKGGRMAEAIFDTLGPDAVGELLATLLERHAGGAFTLDDLVAAGATVDEDLATLFADWVGGTGLPGFVAESAELYRLPDSGSGDTRYQLLVRVRNDEPVTGFARLAWSMQATGERATSDPVRIAGGSVVELGVVLSEPPAAAFVHPYLSLNRDNFLAGTFNTAQVRSRDAEPFDGVRAVAEDLRTDDPRADGRVVVDDLDEGFAIVTGEGSGDLRLGGRDEPAAGMDRGLPVATGASVPTRWSRRPVQSAWGRYRHTLAYMAPGDGTTRAVLSTSLPAAGLWELELHQPFLQYVAPENRGTWHLTIVSEYGRETVDYDATIGAIGWNLVGEFDLPASEVRVEISDATDGTLIVADAVAWSPVRVRAPAGADSGGAAEADTASDADGTVPQ